MQDRIKEIRDRVEKATPAPWDIGDGKELSLYEGKNSVVKKGGRVIVSRAIYDSDFDKQTYADVEFIAHSPSDIKYLLDALQEAQFEIDQEKTRNRWLCTQIKQSQAREQELHDIMDYKDKRLAELEQQLQEAQAENAKLKNSELILESERDQEIENNEQLRKQLQEEQFERAQENKRNRWLCTQIKQAENRERVLREALKPFVNTLCAVDIDSGNHDHVYMTVGNYKLTKRDCEIAREALGKEG